MNPFSLKDKVVLVTGAYGHIGEAISLALAGAGAHVVISGRDAEKLECLAEKIRAANQEVSTQVLDVTDRKSIAAAVQILTGKFGKLHGIVNNAYAGRGGDLSKITSEDFDKAVDFSMKGPFEIVTQALPLLRAAHAESAAGASIVNVATMYAHVSPDPNIYGDSGQNNPIHYGAAKAGMVQMSRYLAVHLAKDAIRVNSVSPGPIPRPARNLAEEAFYQRLDQKVPLGRIGKPSEVAYPIVFLLSDAASYITGADLPVDGGWTTW